MTSHLVSLWNRDLGNSDIVICLRTEYFGVHKNSLKRVRVFQIELEFGSVGF